MNIKNQVIAQSKNAKSISKFNKLANAMNVPKKILSAIIDDVKFDIRNLASKKYTDRPSPPYMATECKGEVRTGNNGKLYESKPNKNDVWSWKLKK